MSVCSISFPAAATGEAAGAACFDSAFFDACLPFLTLVEAVGAGGESVVAECGFLEEWGLSELPMTGWMSAVKAAVSALSSCCSLSGNQSDKLVSSSLASTLQNHENQQMSK